jgi:hypothetical protein
MHLCIIYQAVFRRFLRPEKDYLSFSLIYKNGQRSLDLVKDKFFMLVLTDAKCLIFIYA